MVILDIMENPGTTFTGVAKRCEHTYRKSYIHTCLTRLKALGYVEDKGISATELYVIDKEATEMVKEA